MDDGLVLAVFIYLGGLVFVIVAGIKMTVDNIKKNKGAK